jgi:hypothetical protein
MRLSSQHACRRCARPMQEVASIKPIGSAPGLLAFICVRCGSSDNVLVQPISRGREVENTRRQEQV